MKRGFIIKLRLWWAFNNPLIITRVLIRNIKIKDARNNYGIPHNFDDIVKEFNNPTEPGFLLKYPNYFNWLQKEEEIRRNVGVYFSFSRLKKQFFTFN